MSTKNEVHTIAITRHCLMNDRASFAIPCRSSFPFPLDPIYIIYLCDQHIHCLGNAYLCLILISKHISNYHCLTVLDILRYFIVISDCLMTLCTSTGVSPPGSSHLCMTPKTKVRRVFDKLTVNEQQLGHAVGMRGVRPCPHD